MEGFLILLGLGLMTIPFVLPIVALRRSRRVGPLSDRVAAIEAELVEVRAENVRLRALVEELADRDEGEAPLEATPTNVKPLPPMEEIPTRVRVAPEAAALAALEDLAQAARSEALDAKVSVTDVGAVAVTGAAPGSGSASESVPAAATVSASETESGSGSGSGSTGTETGSGSGSTGEKPEAFNWEQWLGVRGAAVLGGVVLALAGILFFQYSIQHGLISPAMRVVIGTLVGVGSLVGSTRLRRYGSAANALAGGGAVVLYACFWAARALYQLVPMEAAFFLMALTTAATAIMAARYGSLLIASLGLAGGFLTPLLLSTGANRPIGLFGYLLVLDAGFLVVAFRRRWGGLALFALAGTLLLEAIWVGAKMEPGQLAIGLGATGLFAVLFLASGARAPKDGPRPVLWLATQATAVLLPHGFALYFALDAELGHHLYPVALLLLLLSIAAFYVAEVGGEPRLAFLPTAAGAGTLAVVASWLGKTTLTPALGWESAAVAVGLSLPALVVGLRGRPAVSALLYPGGLFFVLLASAVGGELATPWPFVVAFAVLSIFLVAMARRPEASALLAVAPSLLGLGLALLPLAHGHDERFPLPPRYIVAELVLFVLAYAYALRRLPAKDAPARRSAEGALFLGALCLLGLAGWPRFLAQPPLFVYQLVPVGWTLLLVGLVLVRGNGSFLIAAALPALALHAAATSATLGSDRRASPVALLGCAALVALFTRAPYLRWPRLRGHVAFYVAALSGLAWLLPSLALYRDRYGVVGQGGVALAFAVLTLGALPEVRTRTRLDDPLRKSAIVWLAGAALGLLSIAIPLELDRQWITIGYALECAALLLLWERLDHPGLKYLALALGATVAVRLCANPSVLLYAGRGSMRILNWVLYTYWVPAIALLVGLRALGPWELARLRDWELGIYAPRDLEPGDDVRAASRPLGVVLLGLSVILILFVWINLSIADWFGRGDSLTLDFERTPARNLTTSIAWALYAVVLLALGVWRRSSALRWVSLAMLVITIGKVFLYDLGQLKDLYRVVSLLGLAISLIGVSLAYQRFVFRKPLGEKKA